MDHEDATSLLFDPYPDERGLHVSPSHHMIMNLYNIIFWSKIRQSCYGMVLLHTLSYMYIKMSRNMSAMSQSAPADMSGNFSQMY